jgi:DNA polymerase, archaea type
LEYNKIIYGKDSTQNIVSIEVKNNQVELFTELDGKISSKLIPNKYWLLCNKPLGSNWSKLEGNLYYKYGQTYTDKKQFQEDRFKLKKNDLYNIWDDKEAAMVSQGFTYFKGMKVSDVSTLSFDIESTTLDHNENSKVLIISNTYRNKNKIERKLFCYDEYNSEADMFNAWCEWVRDCNPSIILGHNIYSFDLPYLNFCANKAGTTLALGRDNSDITFNNKESKYRIDGAKDYLYYKCFIYGREIIDTLFLSYKYDISRKYENYSLKNIIKQENLEIKDRQFYDAGQIRFKYNIPEEWIKIKQYALHDADDSLALYDLMIPAYFYLTQSVPKSFQSMITSASGSQINSFLVRSYLQDNHSIPKQSESVKFEGAISIGNPGVYKNVFKVDVASLYPSIMLEYKTFDKLKDPLGHFQLMVEHFTKERLSNKKLGKETNDKYYKDLEQSQKIVINSAYGMMGATGLNFNSPYNAALVTRKGREILQKSIDWALENKFTLVNADTDSISITYNNEYLSEEERKEILTCINSLFPQLIRFEDDGYYDTVFILKIKNYTLWDGKKLKIKGSALKASMKEPKLKDFINEVVNSFINGSQSDIINIYNNYVKEIYNIKDITKWCSKRNITENVLNPERTNEQKILDAIEGSEYEQGDKVYVYFDINGNLKLKENWNNDHDPITLLEKLYKTLKIFETVLDIKQYPNYSLVKNQNIARTMAGLPVIVKEKKTRKKTVDTEAVA